MRTIYLKRRKRYWTINVNTQQIDKSLSLYSFKEKKRNRNTFKFESKVIFSTKTFIGIKCFFFLHFCFPCLLFEIYSNLHTINILIVIYINYKLKNFTSRRIIITIAFSLSLSSFHLLLFLYNTL